MKLLSEEELAKIIDRQVHSFDIGLGGDVNLLDAIATYRCEDSVGPANELMETFSANCAKAIIDYFSGEAQ